MKKIFLIFLIGFFCIQLDISAQKKSRKSSRTSIKYPQATDAKSRHSGYQARQKILQESYLANVPFRSIGPTVMSGRVVDIAVNPKDPSHFYVAFASGGLWETKNEGATYEPLFDNEIVMTIGDIAVNWNTGSIYIGSGENNSSRSSYAGYGVYKSDDNGKSWSHLGLEETQHIGRVILHPENNDIIWVAALGRLYSTNEERGLYKSTDGGKTWRKTLFIDESTGIIDLAIDPSNPNKLIAAAWQKDRKAWNFSGAGKGSGIYISEDGGEKWTKSSKGFPETTGVGRIGLAISQSNPNIIYAMHDNQDRRIKETEKDNSNLSKGDIKSMDQSKFLSLSNDAINDFLDDNNFPSDYNAVDIKKQVSSGQLQHTALVEFLEDANSLLFDTPVKGAEMYRSNDGGKTWNKTHEGQIENLVFSYGYYFGQVRIDAQNPDVIYTFGVPVITSADGGKTWSSIDGANVHSDHHALWVNPQKPGHLILGNDGGVNISYDNGKTWIHTNSIPVGQFYSVNVDMAKPYNVYGGLQDNGVWKGPSNYRHSFNWYSNGKYPYERIMGGDGMQVDIDTRDNSTVYTGFQFGNYFRLNTKSGQRNYITPRHKLGERPYRWNWQSPIQISKHNQDIIYMGSNKFHRSFNQGSDFETFPKDLTNGGKKGNVSYGTLSSIDESPLVFGLIYTGSDDGLVHVTKDGGNSFKNITGNLPKNFWVSRVIASKHDKNRVYVSLNGYRWDNFDAMIYQSDDQGNSWKKIGANLPKEPVNVIKEDPINSNILYVGTDHGTYVSIDRGLNFMGIGKDLPAVPVHDLVIHPRENDLVIGTHGRSIYVADISPIQQLTNELISSGLKLYPISKITYSDRWGEQRSQWNEAFVPNREVIFFANKEGKFELVLKTNDDQIVSTIPIDADRGLNYYNFDFSTASSIFKDLKVKANGQSYLPAGKYTVTIKGNNQEDSTSLNIEEPRKRPKRKGSK